MAKKTSYQDLATRVEELEKTTCDYEQMEAQLLKLSHAVEQSPSAIMITDASGAIEYVNPRFTEMTGLLGEKVIGKNAAELGKQSSEDKQNMWNVIKSGGVWHGEFHNRKKTGEYYWERASISCLKSKTNAITHYIKISEDITELKEAQKALMESEQQRYQDQKSMAVLKFANDLALKLMDELRNPLTAIGGFANRITQKDFTGEKLSDYAQIIFEQSQKLDAALNRALNYLRSASEKPLV
ncbi:MAG: PAS domain S-box protein [Deltaproteobacteria bacterium]|nr:PAS domain S-box protein [Deltaproteobacteria bacterium]